MTEASDPVPTQSVLIAEDEPPLRDILVQSFQAAGFTTLAAANGKETIALALKEHPAVMILDIMMPEVDGMEALKKIRLDPWGRNALAIMLTNLTADNKILKELETTKPSYYFVKSDMEPDQLINKVKEILGSNSPAA